ncbi:Hypothetical protein VCSRO184_0856 [Vibrio cholerae]|uniref:hypothetical protein n=1 Tax=Vibrio cholerae TaxID=666 RepID=UPI00019F70F2|nr:hypothetical protein [Vibrio cholerae]EEO05886.1 hypothetical protein VIF_002499 [Vibrio cholerae TM 11079-80]EMP84944.1 hypothetical protein VC116063_002339 [Vibrio cholerae O1 str. 116063]OFI85096.1 hypothetical protein BFX18_09500 [Vibrio cholerae]OFJ15279.1 hypothetical protein BFX28_09745 [Vibrio cholerae]OFJ19213.1 hypothetical protein BFX29_09595 [Vibrio cholerae]
MNNYIAAYLNENGSLALSTKTKEVVNMQLGSFPSFNDAVEHACDVLEGRIIAEGVLHRETGFGGFLICNEEEFETLSKEVKQDAKS